jgi:hypothetical protein
MWPVVESLAEQDHPHEAGHLAAHHRHTRLGGRQRIGLEGVSGSLSCRNVGSLCSQGSSAASRKPLVPSDTIDLDGVSCLWISRMRRSSSWWTMDGVSAQMPSLSASSLPPGSIEEKETEKPEANTVSHSQNDRTRSDPA